MSTLAKVLGFSFALTLVFTLVANTLPQIEGEAPVDEEIDLGALTMDSFIATGESLFSGKGTCTLCHNDLGRAPDILVLNMVETARQRLSDTRYKGQAEDVETYLRESMVSPGAFVVEGFGTKGSNDSESPMPAIDAAPIGLSDIEIDAVIAFMQAKDGNTVSVALPTEADVDDSAEAPTEAVAVAAPAQTAEEAIGKHTCSACHTVLTSESPVGPSLVDVAERLSPAEIRQSILDPAAVVAEGFTPIMPTDFGARLTAGELEMLVEFFSQKSN
jgi:mono/diheme cytochrome c family protein